MTSICITKWKVANIRLIPRMRLRSMSSGLRPVAPDFVRIVRRGTFSRACFLCTLLKNRTIAQNVIARLSNIRKMIDWLLVDSYNHFTNTFTLLWNDLKADGIPAPRPSAARRHDRALNGQRRSHGGCILKFLTATSLTAGRRTRGTALSRVDTLGRSSPVVNRANRLRLYVHAPPFPFCRRASLSPTCRFFSGFILFYFFTNQIIRRTSPSRDSWATDFGFLPFYLKIKDDKPWMPRMEIRSACLESNV